MLFFYSIFENYSIKKKRISYHGIATAIMDADSRWSFAQLFCVEPRRLKREERLLPISKLTPLLADTDMADNATESSLVASRGLMSFLQLPN